MFDFATFSLVLIEAWLVIPAAYQERTAKPNHGLIFIKAHRMAWTTFLCLESHIHSKDILALSI
jgi:hypothetical protein